MGGEPDADGPIPGCLYLVSTPIGNLGDITLRALEVLKEVSLIACEDTRRTRKILVRYGIRTPTTSYHQFNEAARAPGLVRKIRSGEKLALVTDGGTPCISDPGYHLIRQVREAGAKVFSVPGPSAVVAALSVSGLRSERFHFEGFLPARQGPRKKRIRELAGIPETLVLFEAPHRIRRTLEDLLDLLGDRQVALARELTKIHEECRLGRLSQILQELPQTIRGELTLVVQGPEDNRPGQQVPREEDLLREIESSPGRSTGQAVREVARRHGLSSRDAYKLWVRKGGKGRSTRKSPKK